MWCVCCVEPTSEDAQRTTVVGAVGEARIQEVEGTRAPSCESGGRVGRGGSE